jgi:hypothetical protein
MRARYPVQLLRVLAHFLAVGLLVGQATSHAATPSPSTDSSADDAAKIKALMLKYNGNNPNLLLNLQQLTNLVKDLQDSKPPYKEIDQHFATSPVMTKDTWTGIEQEQAAPTAQTAMTNYGNSASIMNLEGFTKYDQSSSGSGGGGDGKGTSNANDPFVKWFGKGLQLTQSSTVANAGSTSGTSDQQQPAELSWVNAAHGQSSYSVDGALSYVFNPSPKVTPGEKASDLTYNFVPAVEAHISDNPTAAQNSVSASAPFKLYTVDPKPAFLQGNYIYVGPVYQMDYKADTKTYGGTVLYAPTIPKLGIGYDVLVLSLSGPIYASWQPYVGLESGYAEAAKPGNMREGDYDRFIAQIHGQIYITDNFEIAADYYYRYFLSDGPFIKNDRDVFDYVQASATYYFDTTKHFSLGATLKDGRMAPAFQRTQSISAFVGVRF